MQPASRIARGLSLHLELSAHKILVKDDVATVEGPTLIGEVARVKVEVDPGAGADFHRAAKLSQHQRHHRHHARLLIAPVQGVQHLSRRPPLL